MKNILFVLCLLALVAMPAYAQTESFTAPSGYAVWAIDLNVPPYTDGTVTIHLYNGDTITAPFSYQQNGIIPTSMDAEASIGSSATKSFTYAVPLNLQIQIWNGDNVTYARQLKLGYGQAGGVWNNVMETTIAASPIQSFTVVADNNVGVKPQTVKYSDAEAQLNPPEGFDLIALLTYYTPLIVTIFASLIYWLKFLFIDNLVLVVALYLTGTMAYAINTSSNIFTFYKTWFRQQAAMFTFIANSFSITFQIVTQVAMVVGTAISGIAGVLIQALIKLI